MDIFQDENYAMELVDGHGQRGTDDLFSFALFDIMLTYHVLSLIHSSHFIPRLRVMAQVAYIKAQIIRLFYPRLAIF